MTDWLIIANNTAGSADRTDILRAAAVLGDSGDVQVAWTDTPDDLEEVLDTTPHAKVVIAGGDGSVHAVVNALHGRDELDRGCAIVPLGTGNDLARGQALPLDAVEAVTGLEPGSSRKMFAMRFDGRLAVNAVHVGAGARAAARASSWGKRLGRLTYPLAALAELGRTDGLDCTVDVDGETVFVGEAEAVFVATGPNIGGGMEVAPDAAATEPRLHVIVLPLERRPLARLRNAARYLRSGIDEVPALGRFDGTEVTIASARGRAIPVDIDGELDTVDGSVRVRLGPPWTLLTPSAA